MSPALMRYLASYSGPDPDSGLHSLEITGLHPWYDNTQSFLDASADEFFATVIPLHVHSLIRLTLQLHHQSRWSFSAARQEVISSLKSLRALRMAVNADDVLEGKPILSALFTTTSTLPHLTFLGISCANSPPRESSENRQWGGTSEYEYMQYFMEGITDFWNVLSTDADFGPGWTHAPWRPHDTAKRLAGFVESLRPERSGSSMGSASSMRIALERRLY
ncbi:hypothetical protein C8F01DRAFT_1281239 [Mycena amicta]|nr:hypothetical protein C8F01DRAFT_1281239 [Mycena amicta]